MSQAIKKLQGGGNATDTPKLFQNYDELIQVPVLLRMLQENLRQFMIDNKIDKEDFIKEVQNTVNSFIKKLDAGQIKRSGTGFIDETGELKNLDGKGNDPVGVSAKFLNETITKAPKYKKPEEINTDKVEQKKEYFPSDFGLNLFIRSGNTADRLSKLEYNDRLEQLSNILLNITPDKYKDYDFSRSYFDSYDDFNNTLTSAKQALSDDNKLSLKESNLFNRLGFSNDLIDLFNYIEPVQPSKEQTEEEKFNNLVKEYDTNKELDLTQKWVDTANLFEKSTPIKLGNDFYNLDKEGSRWEQNTSKSSDKSAYLNDFIKFFTLYNPIKNSENVAFNDPLNIFGAQGERWIQWTRKPDAPALNMTKNEYISYMLNVLKYEGLLDNYKISDDVYGLPFSIDEEKGTIIIWDSKNNTLQEVPAWENFSEQIKSSYELQNPRPKRYTYSNKKGGVLKMQFGSEFVPEASISKQKEEQKLKQELKSSGQTKEQYNESQRVADFGSNLTTVDKIRLGSSIADLVSIAAAFIPVYGTAASAVTGVGSTAANTVADSIEGIDSPGKIAGRTVKNLGLDLVGLIPYIGAAGKLGKIGKAISKVNPKTISKITGTILTAYAGTQLLSPDVLHSFEKLNSKAEDLTVDDWKNIASVLTTIVGTSRLVKSSYNSKIMRNQSHVPEKDVTVKREGTIKTKEGLKYPILDPEYSQLEAAIEGNLIESANNIIKNLEDASGNKVGDKGHIKTRFNKNKKISNPPFPFKGPLQETVKGGTKPYYDPSLLEGYGNPDKRWTNAWLFRQAYGLNYTPKVPTPKVSTAPNYDISGYVTPYDKKGGVLKAQTGTILKDWRKTKWFNPEYKYTYENVTSDANTGKWDDMYSINIPNLYVDIDAFNKVINTPLGTSKTYNDPTWQKWNDAFYETGLNRYFGWDENVAKYFGPTTYNRLAFIEDLKNKAKNGGIKVSNGTLKYDDLNLFYFEKPESSGNNSSLKPTNFGFTPKLSTLGPLPNLQLKLGDFWKQGTLNESTPSTTTVPTNETTGSLFDPSDYKAGWFRRAIDYTNDEIRPRLNGYKTNPDVLANITLGGNYLNNIHVRNLIRDSIKPHLIDTWTELVQQTGNYFDKALYDKRADALQYLAKTRATSDLATNDNLFLEAAKQADDLRIQGGSMYNQGVKEDQLRAHQAEVGNSLRRVEVGNTNTGTMLLTQAAKAQIDAATHSANWESLKTRLDEIRQRALLNREGIAKLALDNALRSELLRSSQDEEYMRNQRILSDMNASDSEKIAAQNYMTQYQADLQKRLNDIRVQAYYGNLFNYHLKKGGKVRVHKKDNSVENNKLFYKAIKDSRDAHLKLLDNLSAVTKHLILKALS